MIEHFPTNERLHTDVLEEKYGNIKADVIQHTDSLREAHLIDDIGISRTYAITFLEKFDKNIEISKVNEKIKSGGSIGKTFRAHGFSIRKNVIDVYTVKISQKIKNKFNVKGDFSKVRLSEFYAKKINEDPLVYGVVAEIYSPDFRNPIVNNYDESQISALSYYLEKKGINKNEIWRRIGLDNDYHDLQEELNLAKKDSLDQIFRVKENIINILKKE